MTRTLVRPDEPAPAGASARRGARPFRLRRLAAVLAAAGALMETCLFALTPAQ